MKIKVGIDVDGVLRDFVGQIARLAFEETGVMVKNPTTYYYDIEKETGLSFRSKIWKTKEWAKPVFEDADVLPLAMEGYKKFLEDDKYFVYIVTTQTDDTKHHTFNWLDKNGFDGYEKIYVTGKKLEAPCQILIDDKISNVKQYDNASRLGILMDTTYNKEYNSPRRVSNLIEAYNLLEEKYG